MQSVFWTKFANFEAIISSRQKILQFGPFLNLEGRRQHLNTRERVREIEKERESERETEKESVRKRVRERERKRE